MRCQDDARRVPARLSLAGDHDRVRGVGRIEAIRGAERRGVGKGRIAGKQLVGDRGPGERALEADAIEVDVHDRRAFEGGASWAGQATGTTCFPSRPRPRSPRTAAAPCSDCLLYTSDAADEEDSV